LQSSLKDLSITIIIMSSLSMPLQSSLKDLSSITIIIFALTFTSTSYSALGHAESLPVHLAKAKKLKGTQP